MSQRTDIFYIFIWIFVAQVAGSYIKTSYRTTWGKAINNCSIATPDIFFNVSNIELSVNVSTSLAEEEQAWIGYCKVPTAFEYIGCMKIENRNPSFDNLQNVPGLCYSACGKTKEGLVGVRGSKCFCLNKESIVDFGLDNCTDVCKDQRDITCGGVNHMSIYRFTSNVTIPNGEMESQCFKYEINSVKPNPFWQNCKGNLKTMCSFKNHTILFASATHPYGTTYLPWHRSMHLCFKNSGYPISAENFTALLNDRQKLTPIWTGIIKSDVIYKSSEIAGYKPMMCGYLTKMKENIIVKFGSIKAVKKVLCNIETSSPMTTPTTFWTTSKSSSRIDSTKTEITSPVTTPTTTFKTSSKLTSSIDSTETEVTLPSGTHSTPFTDISAGTEPAVSGGQVGESGDSEVGAITGASIVSVLVVIAVVVVIVILKRRKKLPSLCKEAVPAKEFGYQQPKRTIDEMSRENHDYDQANVGTDNTVNINSDSNYAHTYFVLEQHVNESNTDNTTYDTSGNANKTITEPDNVYNRLKTDNNQTYDHAHTKIRNRVLKFDDTYDTTDKAAMKLKTRPGKDSDAFGETDEDAYNHITSKTVTNTKTENEYGVPNTLENAYGDVGANNKNNTHDEGDTYSHINNKPQNKGKQGNPFSESKQMRISKLPEGNQDEDNDVTDGDDKLLTTDNDYSTIGTVH